MGTIVKKAKTVIVCETGYLIEFGLEELLKKQTTIFIPAFCIKELEKLMYTYPNALDALMTFWTENRIFSVNLNGKETLLKEPFLPVKIRHIGIVALCIMLINSGYKVQLYTNCNAIRRLAKLQNCGIITVYAKKLTKPL